MSASQRLIQQARSALRDLGLPREQQNDRSAICLVGLLGLVPGRSWNEATPGLIGIRGLLDVARNTFGRRYAENTRETFRRQTMHQFVSAGLALYNPDLPGRPVNSPRATYRISDEALEALRQFGTADWPAACAHFLANNQRLVERYAQAREQERVAVSTRDGSQIKLSPGPHSELIRAVVEGFATRFAPGATLVYVGDTGEKWAYLDEGAMARTGLSVSEHGKMPDVVLLDERRNWVFLVEVVTSHGPVSPKRHGEFLEMLRGSACGPIFVTAFPDRAQMTRFLGEIAWESEVWVADSPSHLIHFDGQRFLGPYEREA